MKYKVCVVTASRAEYGILSHLIKNLNSDREIDLHLIVTGTHLSVNHGYTVKEIQKDNLEIFAEIDMELGSIGNSESEICRSMALLLQKFSEYLQENRPDIICILGDRYELLSIANAATIHRVPVAHIHGGEVSHGAIDDLVRHAITKLSTLHFAATEEYRKRIIQLGEYPDFVFNVGALSLDNLKYLQLASKNELEIVVGRKFKKKNFIVTYHPCTNKQFQEKECKELLCAIRKYLDKHDCCLFVFTYSNADCGGDFINKLISDFVSDNSNNAVLIGSLGYLNYLSMLQFVDAVIGNSSSGIIEVPSFKITTINVGERQDGRIKADSVLDTRSDASDILTAFNMLDLEEWKNKVKGTVNPYNSGQNAAEMIILQIKKYLQKTYNQKKFYDL